MRFLFMICGLWAEKQNLEFSIVLSLIIGFWLTKLLISKNTIAKR